MTHMMRMCNLFHLVPFLEYILHMNFSLCCFRMFLVGLTGGISSGKSTVSSMLRELGCPIIDADVVARKGLWIQHPPAPKTHTHAFYNPPHLQSHNAPPADLSHRKTSSKWNVDVCPRAPHRWLNCAWCDCVYYIIEADMKRLRPVGPSLRQTLGEGAWIMTSVRHADCRGDAVLLRWETERSQT